MSEEAKVGGYCWPYESDDDETAQITDMPSPEPSGDLKIPKKLGGLPVTAVHCWFEDCEDLETVSIPATVTDIEWDTDGAEVDLPTEMDIQFSELNISDDVSYDELIDEISDYLSSNTGYCHNGFSLNNENLIKQALDNAETFKDAVKEPKKKVDVERD